MSATVYAELFRSVIFPGLNVLNGTRIHRVLRLLEEAESYSADQLRELQERKLDRLLSFVRARDGFYGKLWRGACDERRSASLYPALDRLPVVSKDDLRGALDQFPLHGSGRALRVQTSGSTGVPTTFLRSIEQESWFWALRIRMWSWAGFRLGEPYLAINLNARTAWRKKLQDRLFRCTYVTYNADSINSARILSALEGGRIRHINAFGSTLHSLAQYMRDHEISNPGVEVLTSTGDNLHPPQRQLIERVFGVGVTDYYGAGGEGMHLASQCEQGNGYHMHVENSIVEVLKDGRPARPGEVGHIVVTQLDNLAMPLIRYDLGDLATVAEEDPCPCGRAHPRLRSIDGRACDVVRTPSGAELLPQFFFIGAFKTLENVSRYQVVQDELERVRIHLVAEPGCNRKKCESSLRAYLDAATGHSLGIEFDWVKEIALAGSGKPRAVVSRMAPTEAAPLARADELASG